MRSYVDVIAELDPATSFRGQEVELDEDVAWEFDKMTVNPPRFTPSVFVGGNWNNPQQHASAGTAKFLARVYSKEKDVAWDIVKQGSVKYAREVLLTD